MKKLIEKHLQSNGRGRGVILFSPEALQYILSKLSYVPGMNISSNTSILLMNDRKEQDIKVDKSVKDSNKKIADRQAHRAVQERNLRRLTPNVNTTEGYSNGTILDADKVALNKALSWYGLSSGLGLMTNVSDRMRNTPQFGNLMGLLYSDAAKVGLVTGLGAAIAPTLVPGGSFWTKGILWLNPSRYLGRGLYSTILGGENASLLGAGADAGLASYGAAEALLHFYNNPNLGSGVMAAMAAGPVVVGKYNPVGKPIELTVLKIKSGLFTKADLGDYLEGRQIDELLKSIHKFGNAVSEPKILRTLLNKIKMGTKGKKGTNTEINAVKLEEFAKTPEGRLLAIRNKVARINEKTGEEETYWDIINKSALETGINWSDDAVNNPGNYMTGMDTDFKLGYVGGNNDVPFIERYYKNVVDNILGEKGYQAKLILSGDLRKTSRGWEGKLRDGKFHELKHPEEYIKVRYALSKGANVDMPIPVNGNDLYPMHGTRDKDIAYLTNSSSLPGQMGYWTFIRNSKYSKSAAPGHYKGSGYSVPFFWTRPQYEEAPMLPYGNHISNSYGSEAKELYKYMLNQMKVYRPTKVKDSAAPQGLVDEYNFGPLVPNPKSSWNTLDFENGAGPFAYIEQKNSNKNNYA